jgi:hypothetical protein
MAGDNRARHCTSCERTVYNLSALTAEAAADLIAAHEDRICIRLYRRRDGTIITQDCPVGRVERFRKKVRAVIVRAAACLGFLPLAGCPIMMGAVDPQRRADSAVKPAHAANDPRAAGVVQGTPMPPQASAKDSESGPNSDR